MKRLGNKKHAAEKPGEPERWVVDSLEDTPTGKVARVELPGGKTADIALSRLPDDVQEGDILAIHEGPDGLSAQLLPQATAQAQQTAQARLEALNEAGAAAGQEIIL